ncbi:hypothetical protein RTCIAT899_CH11760 [Rhizobium tropici CIAT 899]|nr:hypothetical protein RTCIAT899_CH11760 [Rhizobium tropici CIAT 899]
MLRLARIVIPDIPHHLTQRRNQRVQPSFAIRPGSSSAKWVHCHRNVARTVSWRQVVRSAAAARTWDVSTTIPSSATSIIGLLFP